MSKSALRCLAVLFAVPAVCMAAGTPDPSTSSFTLLTVPNFGCHWVFVPGPGELDTMILEVTALDAASAPCAGLSLTATWAPAGTGNAGVCPEENGQTVMTGADGKATFAYEDCFGCGPLHIAFTYPGVGGDEPLFTAAVGDVTSPDLDADGDTDIFDLAIFASGLPPGSNACSDYTCGGGTNVFDLGVFAGGLAGGC
jgi:hypothetical protein